MNKFAKVEGHHDLYRDNTTGAIINTDKSIFNHTKKSGLSARRKSKKI